MLLMATRSSNLLPWRQQRRDQRLRQFGLAALLTVALAAVVLLLLHRHYQQHLQHFSERENLIRQELTTLQQADARLQSLKQQKRHFEDALGRLSELRDQRDRALEYMALWQSATPAGVVLDTIGQEEAHKHLNGQPNEQRNQHLAAPIRLEGRARSVEQISLLMSRLEQSPLFDAPQLLLVDRAADSAASVITPNGDDAGQVASFTILLAPVTGG